MAVYDPISGKYVDHLNNKMEIIGGGTLVNGSPVQNQYGQRGEFINGVFTPKK